MFNTRFNNGYQTMKQDPYAVYNPQDPYAMYNQDDSMMQNIPYPTPPAETNTAYPQGYSPAGYAKGGEVKKKKGATQNSPYPMLAEMIRQQGNGEDTILAHINPLEAMMLKSMGGSGTINKKTGLPQFGFLQDVLGGGLGAIVGNILMPGIGGLLLGGALGGAAGTAASGSKKYGTGALRGLGMGAAIPSLAGLAGSGLSSLGASGAGSALTKYGNNNAIMPALSKLFGISDSGGAVGSVASGTSSPSNLLTASMLSGSSPSLSATGGQAAANATASAGSGVASNASWFDQLTSKSKDFLTDPKNLLTTLAVGSSFLDRPKKEKPKTPEQLADEQKRLEKALMLSPAERAAKEAELTAEARMHRSVARNKFLPEERLGNLDPLYRKSHTPEEQKRYGKWFSYYNNPNFSGEPMPFADGGSIRSEVVNKAKKLTAEIIERNKNDHGGVLNEKSLIRDFSSLDKTLGLTEAEKNAVERYAENIFRNNQFTDGPGYFYNQAHGNPTAKKTGGLIEGMMGVGTPSKSSYIDGIGGGQDDNIRTSLPDNSYIIDASTVSDLGDGNSRAGANKIDALISNGEYYISPEDVARFGKLGAQRLNSFVKNVRKHKGGAVKLPPKAKPLASYL